jgi:predicted transcriptional regulator
MMSAEREELHRMLDAIPEGLLPAVRKSLESILDGVDDPVRHALENAPLDDEPETEEERKAVEEGRADIRAGRTLSTDELRQELGL